MARQARPRLSLGYRLAAALLWFLQEFTYRGRMVVVTAVLLAVLAVAGMLTWRNWSGPIGRTDEYVVTADRIQLSPAPAWLKKDIAAQALEDAGLAGTLSILDDNLVVRLAEALKLHPWIRRVQRVEKHYPARIEAEVEYRVPVAAIEAEETAAVELYPVAEDSVRLSATDLPGPMLRRLPRIASVGQLPLVGQPFEGPRAAGAIALVQFLANDWDELHLLRVLPSERPEVRHERKFFLYDIVTTGGTLIHWGAAPRLGPPGESMPEDKLARLRSFIAEHGPLDTIESPSVLKVRSDVEATPRVAETPNATPAVE